MKSRKEFTLPKAKLAEEDRTYLESLTKLTAKYFSISISERLSSPWYFVVENGSMFSPPIDAKGSSWVEDNGRSSDEPKSVSFPVAVVKGVQRFISPQSKETLVVFGAEDFGLLEKVAALELYDKLRIQERRALMAVLSAEKLEHGRTSREAVRELIDTDSFRSMNARDQSEVFLKAAEKSSPNLDRNFDLSNFQNAETKEKWRKDSGYTAFQIEEPTDAWENEVKVDGAGRVRIMSLKEDDKTGLEAMKGALCSLPPEMVEYLDTVSLHYKGEGFWWGGGNTIYYVAPKDLKYNGPLVYVVAHEVGHCIMAQKVKGNWNDALQDCMSFPSSYGLTNLQEDFAEFAAIITRAWTKPQEIIEIEEVFPWRFEIYARTLGYNRAKSREAN